MIKHFIKSLIKKLTEISNNVYLSKYRLSADNSVFTHLTTEEKIILHKTIRQLSGSQKRVVAVEIGSYLGASTCFIANALNSQSTLYCIDTWENDAMIYNTGDDKDSNLAPKNTFNEFVSNTAKYANKIKKLRGWSYLVVTDLMRHESAIDFIFIDGDHNYEGVKRDWDTYKPLLKKGSIVALHDTGWAEGVNRVIAEDIKPTATTLHILPNLTVLKING